MTPAGSARPVGAAAPTIAEVAARAPHEARLASPPGPAAAGPAVSVVTVVYNGAATIERTIRSVLAQSPRVEYLVIDGNSSDGTLEVVRRYGGELARWVSEPDAGIYDAMNKGIALARGALIGLINADDWYVEGAVEAVLREAAARPDAGIFYGDILHRVGGDRDVRFRPPPVIRATDFHRMPIPHAATFVRRAVYERLGLYRTDLRLAGDFEFVLRSYRAGVPLAYIARPLSGVAAGGLSDTQSARYRAEVRDVMDAYALGAGVRLRFRAAELQGRVLRAAPRVPGGRFALNAYRSLRDWLRPSGASASAPPSRAAPRSGSP
jgi:glycosyltransferase involved in cell wall biosynthesis